MNSIKLRTSPRSGISIVGVDGWGERLWLLTLLFLIFTGCGDNSGTGQITSTIGATALSDTPETFDAVANASPNKSCPHSQYFLASNTSTWRVVNGYDFNTDDTIEIRENCTFRSYACGTLGYIISGGENFGTGIVNVMMLGYLFPKEGCYALGQQMCSYEQDGAGELRISCQLQKPLETPFKP